MRYVITSRSQELFPRAQTVIPGGVNSPVRAFKAVGREPLFIASGVGAYLIDADGNRYLDCIGSWGPLIFGHCHPRIVEAIRRQVGRGLTFGAPTELEVELAEKISEMVPSCEMVRLVSSGTEATMSAIRLARGYTGRSKFIKFEGCYHGHADPLLSKAGSGVATLGLPDSAGVPPSLTVDTITLPFNDASALQSAFDLYPDQIACVIIEPVVGNSGCIAPKDGYLSMVREITAKAGSVLIFDEVMTGFRLARGGAQERYGVRPDMTTLGKIIGGGLPVGAYGGRADIMRTVAPVGPVYQAGTLSGNPISATAGLETLRMIEDRPELYESLEQRGRKVAEGIRHAAAEARVPVTINQVGSMFTVFFTSCEVCSYTDAKASDTDRFGAFFREMLERGVYLPPSQFEAAFLSDAMSDADINHLIASACEAFKAI